MKIKIRKKYLKQFGLEAKKYKVVAIADIDNSICIKSDIFIWMTIDKLVKNDRKRVVRKYPILEKKG